MNIKGVKPFLVVFSWLAIPAFSFAQQVSLQPSNERKFDLLHTELHLEPNWATQQMPGKATLKLKPHFYEQQSLVLDAKGFDIKSVKVKGQAQKFDYDKQKISLVFDKAYTRKDTLTIDIEYVSKPNEIKVKGSDNIVQDKGLYFINADEKIKNYPRQLWTQGETEANSCWFPTIDSPNQKHTQDIYLTVEDKFVTLSNGLLKDSKKNANGTRTDHWQQNKPHAVYLTMIAAGNFKKVVDSTFKDFEVSYYVEPEYEKYAYGIFGRTPEMIRYFEKLTGVKYAWDKYSQIPVREYVSGAMENTTATVHGQSVLKNANQLIDANDDGVIAHELFHHWFGDLVTAESWSNLPLNESFADYSEYLWADHKYGKDEGDLVAFNALQQYLFESAEKQEPLIRYYYADKEDMFDAHTYQKGGRILHLLRQELGDEAFFQGWQNYLKANAFKNAEVNNLRMAFEEVSGRDLNWFFDQWFLSPGHPRVIVDHKYENGNLLINFKQVSDSLNTRIYEVPLTYEYLVNGVKTRKVVRLKKASEQVEIKMPKAPDMVSVDPEGYFLGVIDHNKSESELIEQFKNSGDVVARITAFEKLTFVESEDENFPNNPLKNKKIRDLTILATKDPFWRVRQLAVQKFADYDGEDFLDVERALQYVIKNDKKSAVKGDAILAMKNFLNPQNDLLFRNALKDSSYMVKAAALEGLLVNKPADAQELVKAVEEIKDVNIFAVVANYYASIPTPERYDWFMTNFERMDNGELYQTLGIFGTYLVQSDAATQEKSIPYLKSLAMDKPQWFVRFSAAQVLYLLTESEKGKKAMKEVIAAEKDQRLKNYYSQLRLE